MKHTQKGFINILLVILIALVGLGGVYLYIQDDNPIVDEGLIRDSLETEDGFDLENNIESDTKTEFENTEDIKQDTVDSNPVSVTNINNINAPSNTYSTYTDVTGLYTVTYPGNWKVLNKNKNVEYGDLVTAFVISGETDTLDVMLISKEVFDTFSKDNFIMKSNVKFGENVFKEFNENKSGDGWNINRKNFVLELGGGVVLIFGTYDLNREIEKVLSSVKINQNKIPEVLRIINAEITLAESKMKDAYIKSFIANSIPRVIIWADDQFSGDYSSVCLPENKKNLFKEIQEYVGESNLICKASKENFIVYTKLQNGTYWCGGASGSNNLTKAPVEVSCQ